MNSQRQECLIAQFQSILLHKLPTVFRCHMHKATISRNYFLFVLLEQGTFHKTAMTAAFFALPGHVTQLKASVMLSHMQTEENSLERGQTSSEGQGKIEATATEAHQRPLKATVLSFRNIFSS